MNLSPNSVNVVNPFAEDLARTRAFYQDVFGLPPIFGDDKPALFKFENMMLMVRDLSGAPELIPPAAVASAEAGSRFVLSVFVDDVDAVVRRTC